MIGKHRTSSRYEATHIDMVPMVDCIMVLLIFLMISSAFVSDPGIEVQKPDVSGISAGAQNALLIAIGKVFWIGRFKKADNAFLAGCRDDMVDGRGHAALVGLVRTKHIKVF